MDTSAVPLMMDMEGGEGEDKRAGVEAGLEGDFAYHNNVAGASKHVRLGGCQTRDNVMDTMTVVCMCSQGS